MEKNVLGKSEIKATATVLIISDDPEAARVWAFSLKQVGLDVCLAGFSEKTLQIWSEEYPDLVVLEDHNAGMDVFEFCRRLRAETAIPILILTSKNNEMHILNAYQAGADDCVPHPVTPRIFQAKARAWLKRSQVMPAAALDELQVSGFRLDPGQRQLALPGGQVVRLTNLESRVLYLLMNHPGWILETDYLVDRAWGYFGDGDGVLLKNVVYRLRKKIEPDPGQPRYLLTESNIGYKFQGPGETPPPPGRRGEDLGPASQGGPDRGARAGQGDMKNGSQDPRPSARGDRRRLRIRETGQLRPGYPLGKE